MPEPNNKRTSRRGFFRDALAHSLESLFDVVSGESVPPEGGSHHVDHPGHPQVQTRLLRPPGAICEPDFAEACHRCGACIEACPADAIIAFSYQDNSSESAPLSLGEGTPVIESRRRACVVCDGLQCTHVCPSGALLPVHDPSEIQMGCASLDTDQCVRSTGDDCALCIDHCPLGHVAIEVGSNGFPAILPSGCVGCGVCEQMCPTDPEAIQVIPDRAR
ncbi:MAG: 4Fe-4S dicluster domain-containing protein [Phycisphaerae bacterium]